MRVREGFSTKKFLFHQPRNCRTMRLRRVTLPLSSGYCKMNICLFQVHLDIKYRLLQLFCLHGLIYLRLCLVLLSSKHSTPYVPSWHMLRLNGRLSLRHLCNQLDFGTLRRSAPVLHHDGVPDSIVTIIFQFLRLNSFCSRSTSSYMFKFILQPKA